MSYNNINKDINKIAVCSGSGSDYLELAKELSPRMYEIALNEYLEKKGYKRYEISNFAIDGYESKAEYIIDKIGSSKYHLIRKRYLHHILDTA